ncbi:MAG: hypothetical protein HQM13_08295 [SAR324 cluster bacterium]|nr:hypothetical protein [SAR324 cluster bacterium]
MDQGRGALYFSRFSRSVKISEIAALSVLGRCLPGEQLKKAVRRSWAAKMVGLRGVPMKFSQILSITRNEDLASIQQEALAELEPLPLDQILHYVKEHAPDLWGRMESISESGIPASLGQVHQVKLDSGEVCALKVKYPGIEHNMELDSALLGMMTRTFHHFKEGFDLQDYDAVIKNELEEELNYTSELNKQQKMFAGHMMSVNVVIPRAFVEYCRDDHILMQWEEGLFLSEFLTVATPREKQQAADALLDFFLKNLFQIGMLHADPNLGNFAFRRTGQGVKLVVYDYGSVIPFPRRNALILLKIIKMVEEGKGDVMPWLVEMGFSPEPLSVLRTRLLAFFDLLLEPLLSAGRYELGRWNRKQRAQEILGPERWNFIIAAPASFLPFMRAIQGLFYYTKELGTGIFARPLLEQYRNQWEAEVEGLTTTLSEDAMRQTEMAAHLKILVLKNGQTHVSLTFPRRAVENLENLMEEELQEKLKSQNVSLDEVLRKCRENGYQAMTLFEYQNGQKTIKVFLE